MREDRTSSLELTSVDSSFKTLTCNVTSLSLWFPSLLHLGGKTLKITCIMWRKQRRLRSMVRGWGMERCNESVDTLLSGKEQSLESWVWSLLSGLWPRVHPDTSLQCHLRCLASTFLRSCSSLTDTHTHTDTDRWCKCGDCVKMFNINKSLSK